jgi:hypothetical protein
MANDLTPTGGGGDDPYSAYAAKVVQQEGTFLSFKTGEWLYGKDGDSLSLGTKLIANLPGLKIGWLRWQNKQVTDDRMELLTTQTIRLRREELGDLDETLWDIDSATGKPRDPWRFTNALQLSTDDAEVYIYGTSSKGGLNAIGRLCQVYGREYRQRPNMLPIVELQKDFYMHQTYGKTYFPVFNVVGWTSSDNPTTTPQAAIEPPKSGGRGSKAGAGAPSSIATQRDLDDDIPF